MKRATLHFKSHYERLNASLTNPHPVLAEEVLRLALENHAIGAVSAMPDSSVCWHLGRVAKRLAQGRAQWGHQARLELWFFALYGEWCARGKPEAVYVAQAPEPLPV